LIQDRRPDEEPAMTQAARSFYAHDRGGHRQGGCLIETADSFHEAAIAFAERAAAAEADGALSVIVKDCETGEEQCFVVHLDEGEAEPC
jgi:hypothetical protein